MEGKDSSDEVVHKYYLLYKPFDMVSQFKSPDNVRLLNALPFNFPLGTHAIGRLDKDSEGLLLLTTNKHITRMLQRRETPHKRVYLVQVRGLVQPPTLAILREGLSLPGRGNAEYISKPVEVDIIGKPSFVHSLPQFPFELPSTTWLRMVLTEGKFHQVRKMVGTVGHRCLRLVRFSIEALSLSGMSPGEVKEIEESFFYKRSDLPQDKKNY